MKNILKNEMKMLLKRKTIVILIVAFLMVLPFVALINADTPTEYDHYYYMELSQTACNATPLNGLYHTLVFKGFVLNKYLQPVTNTEILINNITVNGAISIAVKTNSKGIFNATRNYADGIPPDCLSVPTNFYLSERPQSIQAKDFQVFIFNQNIMNFYIPGIQGSQSDHIYLNRNFITLNSSKPGESSTETPGRYQLSANVSYSLLPYYNLGLYGVAPVFYNGGNTTATLWITQGQYDSKINGFTYIPNSTVEINVSAHSVSEPFGYSQILEMNKNGAISVRYVQSSFGLQSLNANNNYFSFGQSFIIFAYLIGSLAVSMLVLSVINEIYGLPEREVYSSLPHRRRNLIFLKFFTGIITILITEGFGIAFAEILDLVIYHSLLSPYVILISTIILLSLFMLVSPIYLFIESKRTASSGTKSVLVFIIAFLVPVIVSISMGLLESYLFSDLFYVNNYLTKPMIGDVGEINLLFSMIPFSAPIEMMNYLTYQPFPMVTMFNHRSLFLLTPLLIVPDLLAWFAFIFWISVKRYERN